MDYLGQRQGNEAYRIGIPNSAVTAVEVYVDDNDFITRMKGDLAELLIYDRAVGAPYIEIKLNRPAIARYGMTVQDALQQAGWISDRGSLKRLKVVRFEAGKRREIKVQLTDLLKPGDTLTIGERFF